MLKVKFHPTTILTISFTLFLTMYALYTEIFHNAPIRLDIEQLYSNPIDKKIIADLTEMKIKNRLGNFALINRGTTKLNQWYLEKPRVMPARKKTLKNILKSFKNINVVKLHQHEPINISSYSLDHPLLEIELVSRNNESQIVKLGLINPINNTAYITVNNQNIIYQIENFKYNFPSYELSDFIETKIFSMDIASIESVKIYRYREANPYNDFTKSKQIWNTKKYKSYSQAAIAGVIGKVLNTKAKMILDKKDDELQQTLKNYIENPQYKITIVSNGVSYQYKISSPVNSLPGIKVEKKKNFIMTASDREFPYIVSKEYLQNFRIQYKDIKKQKIKDLIY